MTDAEATALVELAACPNHRRGVPIEDGLGGPIVGHVTLADVVWTHDAGTQPADLPKESN